ncbi:hypothetical protein [Novosphingobium sp.]|uniref:hypothetical protein n=1 Tax=Novosphingobium sp. TaxID=1874826 RepID=UPI003D6D345A
MSFDQAFSRLIVLVPIAHVAACTLYIVGFSLGFGSGVAFLFTATDFFTVTLNGLAKIYFSAAIIPIFMYFIIKNGRQAKKGITGKTWANIAGLIIAFASCMTFVYIGAASYALVRQGYMPSAFDFFGVFLVLVTPLVAFIFRKFNFSYLVGSLLAVEFLGAILFQGYDAGKGYRQLPYRQLAAKSMKCGKYAIVFSVGGKFIAVDSNNRRRIVDADCKDKFYFEPKQIYWRGEAATIF